MKQSLAMYDFYTAQIAEYDAEVKRLYSGIRLQEEEELPPLDKPSQSHSKNAPRNAENIHRHLYRIAKVNLLAIPGVSVSVGQTLLAEVGSDLHQFADAKHFCSWLGLTPLTPPGSRFLRRNVGRFFGDSHNRLCLDSFL